MEISLVAKLLIHLSRSSIRPWVLALWYMYILIVWFLLDDFGFAAGYDYWDSVMVTYSIFQQG